MRAGFHGSVCARDVKSLPPHAPTTLPKPPRHPKAVLLPGTGPPLIITEGLEWPRHLPHKAAHRISELNLFLYLRISGVSLWGRVLVGLTLTTEPFRVGSCLMASGLIPSQENPTERYDTGITSVSVRAGPVPFPTMRPGKIHVETHSLPRKRNA